MNKSLQFSTAVDKLKSIGVRMTPQRHAILAFLLDSKAHPTADDIYKSLEGNFPNMSVATIYNNLRLFKEAGLVQELTYGDASSRFDGDTTEHYHLICTHCGRIEDLFEPVLPALNEDVEKASGYSIEHHRLEFYGTCPDCRKVAN